MFVMSGASVRSSSPGWDVKREIGGTNKPSKHSLIIQYRGYSRWAQITPLILSHFNEKGIHLCRPAIIS